ncbi:MAG: hypothetical protein ACRDOH_05200 [Streptosporangiaceae bacterium]
MTKAPFSATSRRRGAAHRAGTTPLHDARQAARKGPASRWGAGNELRQHGGACTIFVLARPQRTLLPNCPR